MKQITIKDIDYSIAPPDCGDAPPLPRPVGGNKGINHTCVTTALEGLTMNPNNGDEIVYTQAMGYVSKMYYFNLKTKVHRLLYSGHIYGHVAPKWHSTGWILFVTHDGIQSSFYKMEPSGASLHAFADHENERDAAWNDAGDKIAFYGYKKHNRNKLFIRDVPTGQLQDSILDNGISYAFLDWTKPHLFTRQHFNGSISTYNRNTQSHEFLFEKQSGALGFTRLGDDKTLIVALYKGIYLLNTETKQFLKIKCAHGNHYYRCPIYAPQNYKIYAIREKKQIGNPPRNNTNIHIYLELVQMNLDGSEERVIELPVVSFD